MNLLVSELLTILQEELEAYRQVLLLLTKEREAITDASLDDLLSTNREKETLLLAIEALEIARGLISKKLGDLLGFSPRQITLSFLAQQIEGPMSSKLKDYQQQISSLIGAAAGINRENARLLHHSRNITRQLMAILNSQDKFSPLYLPSGTVRSCLPLKGCNQWQV